MHRYGGQSQHGVKQLPGRDGVTNKFGAHANLSADQRAGMWLPSLSKRRASVAPPPIQTTDFANVSTSSVPKSPINFTLPGGTGARGRAASGGSASSGASHRSDHDSGDGDDSDSSDEEGTGPLPDAAHRADRPAWMTVHKVVYDRALSFGAVGAVMSALRRWQHDQQPQPHPAPMPKAQRSPARCGGNSRRSGQRNTGTGGDTDVDSMPRHGPAQQAAVNELVSVMLSVLSQLLTWASPTDKQRLLSAHGVWRLLEATAGVTGTPLPTPAPTPAKKAPAPTFTFGQSRYPPHLPAGIVEV